MNLNDFATNYKKNLASLGNDIKNNLKIEKREAENAILNHPLKDALIDAFNALSTLYSIRDNDKKQLFKKINDQLYRGHNYYTPTVLDIYTDKKEKHLIGFSYQGRESERGLVLISIRRKRLLVEVKFNENQKEYFDNDPDRILKVSASLLKKAAALIEPTVELITKFITDNVLSSDGGN